MENPSPSYFRIRGILRGLAAALVLWNLYVQAKPYVLDGRSMNHSEKMGAIFSLCVVLMIAGGLWAVSKRFAGFLTRELGLDIPDAAALSTADLEHQRQLGALRRRRLLMVVAFSLALGIPATIVRQLRRHGYFAADEFLLGFGIVAVALVVGIAAWRKWRCPSCGEPLEDLMPSKCKNCGMRLFDKP
jgi:hypothetical protein